VRKLSLLTQSNHSSAAAYENQRNEVQCSVWFSMLALMLTFYIPSSSFWWYTLVLVGTWWNTYSLCLMHSLMKPDRATGSGLVKKMSTTPPLCKGLCLFKHYHTQWMAVNCGGSCFWRHQSIFCLCIKYLRNRWTDLCQICMEDLFGPSLGGVWRSKIKVTRDKSCIFRPIWWPAYVCVW